MLYHYERKWGTTTYGEQDNSLEKLYHYERKWGTTTGAVGFMIAVELYHYERKWGTTTMSLPPIFREDYTAYYIRIYRFRQSPNGEKRF